MIQTWASSNFMTFNESKCKVMHISRKRYPLSPCTSIMLNGSILETVTMYKYLGLLISSDLSWSNHIQSVCSKARKILGLIYRKYYRFSDTATLLQLYRSLVRPHLLLYGILTYNVTFNYLKECKSLHVGCVAKHGRLATRNYYLLCNSLLSQIVDCSSGCAPYSRFSTDCVTFLKMYFLPGKLGHMFVDL